MSVLEMERSHESSCLSFSWSAGRSVGSWSVIIQKKGSRETSEASIGALAVFIRLWPEIQGRIMNRYLMSSEIQLYVTYLVDHILDLFLPSVVQLILGSLQQLKHLLIQIKHVSNPLR